MTSPPGLVTMTLWGVAPIRVPQAVGRMATDRFRLARTPGLLFAKLLGTGDGRTFTARDADPLHWGLLACWRDEQAAADALAGPVGRGWDRIARERLHVRLRPVHSRGRWARRAPFGDPVPGAPPHGPVASVTRARLRPATARSFWRSVPPVSADLHQVTGLRLAVGIGEAPVGLQGTFSLWQDSASLLEFAHRRRPHAEVVRRTAAEGWYAEELFARFAVLSADGTFDGRAPLGDEHRQG
jgi:hypothetical protein